MGDAMSQPMMKKSPEMMLNEMTAKAQADLGTKQAELASAVAQLPPELRGAPNDQIQAKITELQNSSPAAWFATRWPDLDTNGSPNVMTLEELGRIKEFVQKLKERITAVLVMCARTSGMGGDAVIRAGTSQG
jgi:hypothetical protein